MAETTGRVDQLGVELKSLREGLKGRRAELTKLGNEARAATARREFLGRELDRVEGSLREAKADRRESERDRKLAATVEALKKLFPGERERKEGMGRGRWSEKGRGGGSVRGEVERARRGGGESAA